MASYKGSDNPEEGSTTGEADYKELNKLSKAHPSARRQAFAQMQEEGGEPPEFYTVEEFAEKSRVASQTVRGWLKTGRIKGHKVNVRWLIHRSEFEVIMSPKGHHSMFRVGEYAYDALFAEIKPLLLHKSTHLDIWSKPGKCGNFHFVFIDRPEYKTFAIFNAESLQSLKRWLQRFSPEEMMDIFEATARSED